MLVLSDNLFSSILFPDSCIQSLFHVVHIVQKHNKKLMMNKLKNWLNTSASFYSSLLGVNVIEHPSTVDPQAHT